MKHFLPLALFVLALGISGCSKKPEGIYKSNARVLTRNITLQVDFREDGKCYYNYPPSWHEMMDYIINEYTWKQDGGTIEILHGAKVVDTLRFDGNDLVPVSEWKERRFVKQ